MNATPSEAAKAAENLRILAIFHFVVSGLALLGIGFLAVHFLIMRVMMEKHGHEIPGVPWIYLFYVLFAAYLLVFIVLNTLSACFMLKRRSRTFSTVVGAINCLHFPVGTALGIFAIILLSRAATQELYANVSPRSS